MDFIPQNARVSGIDAQIPLGSIGAQFISKLDDIPKTRAEKFLAASLERVEETQKFINKKDGEFILGVSWASAAPRIGDHKSIALDELRPILSMPGVRPVLLQYGDHQKALMDYVFKYKQPFDMVPDLNLKDDMEGLAALIESCDAVLTVSNATAHLAGALGKKTYLLDSNKLWFWNNRTTRQSLWYPSISVYPRTNVVTPWTEQVEQIHKDMFATSDDYYAPIG
jgi:ADP-heptose:LPS heptosyltransferase